MSTLTRTSSLLEEAEAEVRTDDEWTLVQCKCKSPKMGLDIKSNGVHDHHINEDRDDRERNRFTKVNNIVKWSDNNGTTIKQNDHERDKNRDRKLERERITIKMQSNG